MKQAIAFTIIITLGAALPVGLVTGVIINKSTVTSKIAAAEKQAENEAMKVKELVADAENMQIQYSQLRNKNVQQTKELSEVRSEATDTQNALQNDAKNIKKQYEQLKEQYAQLEEQYVQLAQKHTEIINEALEIHNAQQKKIESLQIEKYDLVQKGNLGKETEQQKKAKLNEIKKRRVDYFDVPLEVGQYGNIRNMRNRLISFQVIDGSNVICELNRYDYKFGFNHGYTNHGTLATIWLTNVDTTGLTDGVGVTAGSPYLIISGTKTYTTAIGGSSTIFVFEPLPQDN